jgi:hypothetical protein
MADSVIPLEKLLQTWTAGPLPVGIAELADAACARHRGVAAVLFYGSCLRSGRADEGLADLYLLVDNYVDACDSRFQAVMNWLLPPNVFYLEIPWRGKTLRAKYAVVSLDDFQQGTCRWFHSYLWARFAQPCGLIAPRNAEVAALIHQSLAGAVRTFVRHTLPQLSETFTPRELWITGLSLTYRCELRTEGPETAARLVDAAPEYYTAISRAALADPRLPLTTESAADPVAYGHKIPLPLKRRNLLAWRLRQVQGKILSILRLLKGLLTFTNGLDYILWKIERHSGVHVEPGPTLRRFPPLAVLVTFWRLFRKGAFR